MWSKRDSVLVCEELCTLLLLFSHSVVPHLWDPMDCSMPGLPVLHPLPEFAQTHVQWVDDDIQLSHPLSLPSPPALNLSQNQDLFWWVISSHQVAKVLEFQHQSFNEYTGLISFRIDWFDLLVVQGTLKILLQLHNSKASILWCSAFFMVQLTSIHDYWKTHSFDCTAKWWCLCFLIPCLGLS